MGNNNRQRRAEKKRKRAARRKELVKKNLYDANRPISPVFYETQNPLSGLTDAERRQVIEEMSQNSKSAFEQALAKIRDSICYYDPKHLLAILATYGLTVGVGDEGVQKKRDSDFWMHQSHIEILQAIALQIDPNKLKNLAPTPDIIQEVGDTLIELMRAYNYRNLDQITTTESEEEKSVTLLQQAMRNTTQVVRNWGYFSQVKTISKELYGYFDGLLKGAYGFTASDVINLFQSLIERFEFANSNRLHILQTLSKEKNRDKLIRKYYELIGESSHQVREFTKEIDIGSLPLRSLFGMIISHYDLTLCDIYEISVKHMAEKLKISETAIKSLLDNFSYGWGDLASYETEHLVLSNPVWLRPIVKMENEKYFCVFPQVFFSFVLQSLNILIEKIDEKGLSKRRADYLENKILEIITRRFPESSTAVDPGGWTAWEWNKL